MVFIVYWVAWCVALPLFVLGGPAEVLDLFREGDVPFTNLGWKTQALLWCPIIFPLAFIFVPRLTKANVPIILVSILIGLIIGITEELLWRGVGDRHFRRVVGSGCHWVCFQHCGVLVWMTLGEAHAGGRHIIFVGSHRSGLGGGFGWSNFECNHSGCGLTPTKGPKLISII